MHQKALEIMHKQSLHVMGVVVEFMKVVLQSAKETEGERLTKKNHLVEQAANVLNWMYEFDP
jgi:hypothetical protein